MLNTKLSTNAQPLKPAIEQALLSLHAQQKQQQKAHQNPNKLKRPHSRQTTKEIA